MKFFLLRHRTGHAGQISLGHADFFGLGAYGSAVLTATYNFPAWPVLEDYLGRMSATA